jgi:hypothetical protein
MQQENELKRTLAPHERELARAGSRENSSREIRLRTGHRDGHRLCLARHRVEAFVVSDIAT